MNFIQIGGVDKTIVLKILVIGDSNCGKTSIIRQYCDNKFVADHKPTIGVDFHLKEILIHDKVVRLQLWDIAGQDRFGVLNRVYYKGAVGAIIVYDITQPKTFSSAEKWKKELDNKVLLPNGNPLPAVLLANKCDLETASTDTVQAAAYVKALGFVDSFDTSAKDNLNIDKAARILAENILQFSDVLAAQQAMQDNYQPGSLPKEYKSSSCC